MKTIITSNEQRDVILRNYAKENHGILKDIQVLPLQVALKEESDDTLVLSLQLSSLLKQEKENFPIYQDMFSFPAFLNEIISFSKECILYDIQYTDLPSNNPNEEELKRIMKIALSLDYAEKENVKHKDKIIDSIKNDPNVSLHYQFLLDSYHYSIYKLLTNTIPTIPYPTNDPSVSIKYALNSRSEAEAIAQDICLHNKPTNIILCDPKTLLPLYESVLTRYNIPFTSLKEQQPLHITLVYKALVMLGIHKDRESLLECIRLNAFEKHASGNVYDFLEETLTSTDMSSDISYLKDSSIFEREIKDHIQQYEYAKEYYDSIKDDVDLLLLSNTPKEILYNAFSIVRKNSLLNDKVEFNAAIDIRNKILETQDYIQNNGDLLFLVRAIENLKSSYQLLQSDFCTITDLTHPVEPKEISYIVSANGSNYPGFPVKSGLFDERYVESILKYPSQKERYSMYMDQLSWISHCATKQLYYSYYTNDYQGREVQLAFDIENQYPNKPEKWNLVSLTNKKKEEHHLDSELSKQLFEKDGKIIGSISTIERWFSCPYSYFIQSGLHIRKKQQPSIDASSIGSVQHKLLEDSFHKNGKQYASICEEEIREFIGPSFEVLHALHPNQTQTIDLTRERMIDGIQVALDFLNDFEKHSSYKQKEAEYQFLEDITEHVTLKGIIDRLDVYANEFVRIIDFKSSSKTLSDSKVKAGTQLQLLTYLIIATRLLQLKPAGSYYYSLKDENNTIPAKKKVRKDFFETEWDEESQHSRMINNKNFSGWTFTDRLTELDDDGTHISSLKTMKDYKLVEECITSLYELFHEEVTDGNISIDPTEKACDFCDYKSICRFHGEKRKPTALVMKDVEFKKGKEKS